MKISVLSSDQKCDSNHENPIQIKKSNFFDFLSKSDFYPTLFSAHRDLPKVYKFSGQIEILLSELFLRFSAKQILLRVLRKTSLIIFWSCRTDESF